ncbi:MAG: DUF4139 domain-containing protein [Pseudomonadota bacterium]|nr:DUF4139 domain-containing protein [Pseudomonadota bacterium]
MKRIVSTLFAGLAAWAISLPLSSYTLAAPVEVTLYPASARIIEIGKLPLKPLDAMTGEAVFLIPGQSDPETLTTKVIGPANAKVLDQRWRQVARQDDRAVTLLKADMEKLKKELWRLQAENRSLETQIQFWQLQTKARVKTPAEAVNTAASIGRHMKKTVQEKLTLEPLIEETTKKIKDLEETILQMTGKKETSWEVTTVLSGVAAREVALSYSYTVVGCGWSSLYRLEAQPLKRLVRFTWDAEIWQSTGQDWRQVNIRLATLQPRKVMEPPELPPWIVKPQERLIYRNRKAAGEAMPLAAAAEAALVSSEGEAPSVTRASSFHVWEMGKRSLAAGHRQRLQVREEEWPVEFLHLARPSQGEQTFVRGEARFADDREIPPGTALFIIDGSLVGKRPFSLTGREGAIYFGSDPLVRATTVLSARYSGEKSLFADKQTQRWEWRIVIDNARNYPVRVRVEEPLPQSRDERIQIGVKNDPAPTESTHEAQIWIVEAPAGGKRQLLTAVSLEAPKDMQLDLGWRR